MALKDSHTPLGKIWLPCKNGINFGDFWETLTESPIQWNIIRNRYQNEKKKNYSLHQY